MTICADRLRAENQPAPRTCSACGLGPCKFPHLVPSEGSPMSLPESVKVPDGIHPGARPAPDAMPAGHREVQPFQRVEALAQDMREAIAAIDGDPRAKATARTKVDEAVMWAREAARATGSKL